MAMQVTLEPSTSTSTKGDCLALSSVSLHIDTLVPLNSLVSGEDRKAATETNTNAESHDKPTLQSTPRRSQLSAQDSWAQFQIADRMKWLMHFKPNKRGGLVFLDHDALKKQQGVFKDVMLQVGSQLLSGKLAVRISLPIRIFEPRTLLERVADGWNYAPTLLKKAALSSADPMERLKFVMAFVAGGVHFCVGQLKPFNPILGETYEATHADGTQIFMEHVGHHPVRSAFHVVGSKGLYQLSGVYEFESITSRNSIVNHQIKMSGIMFGDRVVEIVGCSQFQDTTNGLVGELNFDSNGGFLKKSQSDDIKGHIYPAKKSAKHALSTVSGSWVSHLQFDGKTYWHVESEPAFEHKPVETPLPSDLCFREDVIALKNGDTNLAQSEKLRLEALQRADGKLRENTKITFKKA